MQACTQPNVQLGNSFRRVNIECARSQTSCICIEISVIVMFLFIWAKWKFCCETPQKKEIGVLYEIFVEKKTLSNRRNVLPKCSMNLYNIVCFLVTVSCASCISIDDKPDLDTRGRGSMWWWVHSNVAQNIAYLWLTTLLSMIVIIRSVRSICKDIDSMWTIWRGL